MWESRNSKQKSSLLIERYNMTKEELFVKINDEKRNGAGDMASAEYDNGRLEAMDGAHHLIIEYFKSNEKTKKPETYLGHNV